MAPSSKAGVKGLGLTEKKRSLGFMSHIVSSAPPDRVGHLRGRNGTASKTGSIFCSVSILPLGDVMA